MTNEPEITLTPERAMLVARATWLRKANIADAIKLGITEAAGTAAGFAATTPTQVVILMAAMGFYGGFKGAAIASHYGELAKIRASTPDLGI